jgi:hypothetical protein
MATRTATNKAAKAAKQTQTDLKENVGKIKNTATKLTNEIVDTAVELASDIRYSGVQLGEEATKTVKTAVEKASKPLNVNKVRKAIATTNNQLVKAADEVLDTAAAKSEAWQAVATKAIKGTLTLAAKQQDIIFDTLEAVKGQLVEGNKRMRKLMK